MRAKVLALCLMGCVLSGCVGDPIPKYVVPALPDSEAAKIRSAAFFGPTITRIDGAKPPTNFGLIETTLVPGMHEIEIEWTVSIANTSTSYTAMYRLDFAKGHFYRVAVLGVAQELALVDETASTALILHGRDAGKTRPYKQPEKRDRNGA